jgi:hypothetical protein
MESLNGITVSTNVSGFCEINKISICFFLLGFLIVVIVGNGLNWFKDFG